MPDTSAGHRVLVVDDEQNLAEVVTMALRFQGFTVETAGTGREALAAVAKFKPHLMVLDVMLPDMEGFEVAKRLGAQRAGVPIIFLTARDATEDKVRGLSGGGDDYMTKPFSLEELVARIRTILRRTGQATPESSRLVFEDLELDEESREVTRGGAPIELTATEYRLLRYLMLNPRRVMTRAQILDHVWDYDFGGDGRVLETYISYLRKKLDAHGKGLIRTVRGVGMPSMGPTASAETPRARSSDTS
jgi:two-component system OmpR family response regulator